jgi:hypothetical protein
MPTNDDLIADLWLELTEAQLRGNVREIQRVSALIDSLGGFDVCDDDSDCVVNGSTLL